MLIFWVHCPGVIIKLPNEYSPLEPHLGGAGMRLTLWDRIAVLRELYLICAATLIPNLRAILAQPSLVLHPKNLKTVVFSNIWAFMAPSVDEGGRQVKESLIRPNAFGSVLDLGAGE